MRHIDFFSTIFDFLKVFRVTSFVFFVPVGLMRVFSIIVKKTNCFSTLSDFLQSVFASFAASVFWKLVGDETKRVFGAYSVAPLNNFGTVPLFLDKFFFRKNHNISFVILTIKKSLL